MKKDYSKFIEFFKKKGFNTVPYLLKIFSYLPPSDRIIVLRSLVAVYNYDVNLYNKLSMALLKNGEFENAIKLLTDAFNNNYLNNVHYQELQEKIEFLYNERGNNFGSAKNYDMTITMLKRDMEQDFGYGWNDSSIKAYKEFCSIMIEFCENQI